MLAPRCYNPPPVWHCTKDDDCKSELTRQHNIASPSTRSLLYLPNLEWQMSGNIHLYEVARELLETR